MQKIFILILVFSVSCKKDSPSSATTGTTVPEVSIPDALPSITIPSGPSAPVINLTWTEEFMDLVNDHRTSIGLRTLIHVDEMGQISRTHGQNMASGLVVFGHSGFSTRCSAARSELGGGNWCGENVAAGQTSPNAVFTSWMNSLGHRGNIEEGRATHTGLGYARSSSGKYYWTQIFLEL